MKLNSATPLNPKLTRHLNHNLCLFIRMGFNRIWTLSLTLSIQWGTLRSPDPPGSYMALGGPLGSYLAPN